MTEQDTLDFKRDAEQFARSAAFKTEMDRISAEMAAYARKVAEASKMQLPDDERDQSYDAVAVGALMGAALNIVFERENRDERIVALFESMVFAALDLCPSVILTSEITNIKFRKERQQTNEQDKD